ncbi:MAG: hypothetical protein LUG60_00255 [Erysipelotrichaceae bacterium]|nr:hypothetical protein [Erysipelotrichaceae bacterium]
MKENITKTKSLDTNIHQETIGNVEKQFNNVSLANHNENAKEDFESFLNTSNNFIDDCKEKTRIFMQNECTKATIDFIKSTDFHTNLPDWLISYYQKTKPSVNDCVDYYEIYNGSFANVEKDMLPFDYYQIIYNTYSGGFRTSDLPFIIYGSIFSLENKFINHLKEQLLHDKTIKDFYEKINENEFNEVLHKIIDNIYINYVYEHLISYFTFDKFLMYLKSNKKLHDETIMLNDCKRKHNYCTQLENESYDVFIKNISQNYQDLFPIARKQQRHFVLHFGKTNEGKTEAIDALKHCIKGIYLAPSTLLAQEQYKALNDNCCLCSLKTKEEHIAVFGEWVCSSTIDMLDFNEHYELAIIDEAQMLRDKYRGAAWTNAMMGVLAEEIHVCATPDVEEKIVGIIEACNDTYEIIYHDEKDRFDQKGIIFDFPNSVEPGNVLIVPSKENVYAIAGELNKKEIKTSIVYESMPYDVRLSEIKRYENGETDVIVSTKVIREGIPLSVKKVVFLDCEQYNNEDGCILGATYKIYKKSQRTGKFYLFDGYYNVDFLKEEMLGESNKEAYISFPESLLGLDAPLSDILNAWNNVDLQQGFAKADMSHEIYLVNKAETLTDDKEIIFNFIKIPFDETDDDLLNLWTDMFESYLHNEFIDFDSIKPQVDYDDINSLEHAYQVCDLIYCYKDRFECGLDNQEVIAMKKEISKSINNLLNSKDFWAQCA